MPRKLIIDCDPGIGDAVALCLALRDPRLEVVAVSAVAGHVSAEQASRNVQSVLDLVDPPRLPRIGVATPLESAPAPTGPALHGDNGLAGLPLPTAELRQPHLAEKILCDEIRADPGNVAVLALGPLTNVARALRRDPSLAGQVNRIIMCGGSVHGVGDVTPAAEFNVFYDPAAAQEVFRSRSTKILVPLEATLPAAVTLDLLAQLPGEDTRLGAFLQPLLRHYFRAHHQLLGVEHLHLPEAVALLAAVEPELFEMREMAGDVETQGELTLGATVFDRRRRRDWRPNMEVAWSVDPDAVRNYLVRGLSG